MPAFAGMTVLLVAACGGNEPTLETRAERLPDPPSTENHNQETPYCDLAGTPQTGLTEISRTPLSERTLDIGLQSAAAGTEQHIVVTVPKHYDASGATRYPVLYLLHGALDDYRSYYDNGIEGLVGERALIVVSPNTGPGNGYTDWYGAVAGSGEHAPAWETHHLAEVLPFVEAHFPVRTDRAGRAIAGISMGGGGTMGYAAHRPELFAYAGSFSGAVNLTRDYPWYPVIQTGTTAITLIPGYGPVGYCTFGDPVLQQVVWRDHDATYLAENLRGVALWMSCGGGKPDDVPYTNSATDPVEVEVCEMTEKFMEALDTAGIAHADDLYDGGTHAWTYWTREIGVFLGWLDAHMAAPLPAPASFAYRSAQPQFSAWGWQFSAYRNAREFVYLSDVSAAGLRVKGSGTLDVRTPPLYGAGRVYSLSIDGAVQKVTADATGRLEFRLDLGASHEPQQMQFDDSASAAWEQREVRIAPR